MFINHSTFTDNPAIRQNLLQLSASTHRGVTTADPVLPYYPILCILHELNLVAWIFHALDFHS